MTIVRRAVAAVAVLVWVAVPVALALVLTARSEESVQTPPVASTWVPAGGVETELGRIVVAVATTGDAPPLLAPSWQGLVEEVLVEPEQALRSGDPVVVIDGITRIAVHTPRPFRRGLAPGDRGRDVADLNAWLAGRDLEATDGDRYGAATQRGVRTLRRELGLPTDESTFDPAWLVYLPLPEVVLRTVALQAGAPVPAAGGVIAELDAQVTGARLLVPQSGATAPGPTTATGPGDAATPSTAPATGTTGAGDTGQGGGAPAATEPTTTTPPAGASGPSSSGVPLDAAADGARLDHAGQPLGPVNRDGTVPLETLAALLPVLGDQESVTLQLVEPAPEGAREVPSAAMFSGPTGLTCIASRALTGEPARAVTVSPALAVTTTGNRTTVVGLPDGDLEVEVNPPRSTRQLCTG